jgi:hypothetical protein
MNIKWLAWSDPKNPKTILSITLISMVKPQYYVEICYNRCMSKQEAYES